MAGGGMSPALFSHMRLDQEDGLEAGSLKRQIVDGVCVRVCV